LIYNGQTLLHVVALHGRTEMHLKELSTLVRFLLV